MIRNFSLVVNECERRVSDKPKLTFSLLLAMHTLKALTYTILPMAKMANIATFFSCFLITFDLSRERKKTLVYSHGNFMCCTTTSNGKKGHSCMRG